MTLNHRDSQYQLEPQAVAANGGTSLLRPGSNCWAVERAARVSFLIDGDAYFRAFRSAAAQARRRIIILGWDFDSRIDLCVGCRSDGFPEKLGEFLHALLMRRRDLHIFVLPWDYHMIYLREREWWLPAKLAANRRLHFYKDGWHPVGASHHQKVAVVDDRVAFVGGLDFAQCRWDTPDHRPDHPARRLFADGKPCRPFHDVQMAVDGGAAAALGRLARDRWKAATGWSIPNQPLSDRHDPWPAGVEPDMRDVPIGIARTMPTFERRSEIREVERLYIDALGAARRHIYLETQYLTSRAIAEVLERRLSEPVGPEVVLVLHPNSDGWLEQHTMDVLRGRVLKRLRAVDRYGRLGLYYPRIPGLGGVCISMHAKVCIVDDELGRVGSANLSNRSMGFDTECDLAVEAAGDANVRAAIAAFRHRLLAEHLDVEADVVARCHVEEGSLIAAIERLRHDGRSLEVFDRQIPPEVDEWVPDEDFVDPPRPYDAQLVPPEQRPRAHRQMIVGAVSLLALLSLAAAWHYTPLRNWMDLPTLVERVEHIDEWPAAPLVAVGGFVLGGLLVMPVTVLIAATVLTFGPLQGFVYSLVGMTLSAIFTFWIGRLLGHNAVDRLAGSRLHRISRSLAERGILAIVVVRVVPVAPFSIINAVAGASHIRAWDFFLGTVIGELPGLLALSIFLDQVSETVRHPGPGSLALLAVTAALIIAAAVGLRRWARRSDADEDS